MLDGKKLRDRIMGRVSKDGISLNVAKATQMRAYIEGSLDAYTMVLRWIDELDE